MKQDQTSKNSLKKSSERGKYNNKKVGQYRSGLEEYTFQRLTEEGIEFEYEQRIYNLIPSFTPKNDFYKGGKGSTLKKAKTIRGTTYKPDFTGNGWVIETKGKITPDFVIKLKLFLAQNNVVYFMPRNRKQVNDVICKLKIMLNIPQ